MRKEELIPVGNAQDLTGLVFGRLTVIGRVKNAACGRTRWLCQCVCGGQTIAQANGLKNGSTTSCGCYMKEIAHNVNTTHGDSHGNKLYHKWIDMKSRCYNVKNDHYQQYGARGITVCDEWKNDYCAFREWAMHSGYAPNLSIDRIDNNKGYSPSNCRWATDAQQRRNKQQTVLVTINNITQCVADWAHEYGFSPSSPYSRVKRKNITIQEAVTQMVKEREHVEAN